jgi:hypothetical protein
MRRTAVTTETTPGRHSHVRELDRPQDRLRIVARRRGRTGGHARFRGADGRPAQRQARGTGGPARRPKEAGCPRPRRVASCSGEPYTAPALRPEAGPWHRWSSSSPRRSNLAAGSDARPTAPPIRQPFAPAMPCNSAMSGRREASSAPWDRGSGLRGRGLDVDRPAIGRHVGPPTRDRLDDDFASHDGILEVIVRLQEQAAAAQAHGNPFERGACPRPRRSITPPLRP